MSLLRIFLEDDHGKRTYEDPTKPMTYQQSNLIVLDVMLPPMRLVSLFIIGIGFVRIGAVRFAVSMWFG